MKLICEKDGTQETLCEITQHEWDVLKHEINEDNLESDLKRRVDWILKHKYKRVMDALRKEWTPKLADNGETSIPVSDEDFANLVFQQDNYKDAKTRQAEAEAEEGV